MSAKGNKLDGISVTAELPPVPFEVKLSMAIGKVPVMEPGNTLKLASVRLPAPMVPGEGAKFQMLAMDTEFRVNRPGSKLRSKPPPTSDSVNPLPVTCRTKIEFVPTAVDIGLSPTVPAIAAVAINKLNDNVRRYLIVILSFLSTSALAGFGLLVFRAN